MRCKYIHYTLVLFVAVVQSLHVHPNLGLEPPKLHKHHEAVSHQLRDGIEPIPNPPPDANRARWKMHGYQGRHRHQARAPAPSSLSSASFSGSVARTTSTTTMTTTVTLKRPSSSSSSLSSQGQCSASVSVSTVTSHHTVYVTQVATVAPIPSSGDGVEPVQALAYSHQYMPVSSSGSAAAVVPTGGASVNAVLAAPKTPGAAAAAAAAAAGSQPPFQYAGSASVTNGRTQATLAANHSSSSTMSSLPSASVSPVLGFDEEGATTESYDDDVMSTSTSSITLGSPQTSSASSDSAIPTYSGLPPDFAPFLEEELGPSSSSSSSSALAAASSAATPATSPSSTSTSSPPAPTLLPAAAAAGTALPPPQEPAEGLELGPSEPQTSVTTTAPSTATPSPPPSTTSTSLGADMMGASPSGTPQRRWRRMRRV